MKKQLLSGAVVLVGGLVLAAGAAQAEVVSVALVPVDNGGAGFQTFDLRVETTKDWLLGQLIARLDVGSFHQDGMGGNTPANPALFPLVPQLAFDTFITGPNAYPNTGVIGEVSVAGAAVDILPGARPATFGEHLLDIAWFDTSDNGPGLWTVARLSISGGASGRLDYFMMDADQQAVAGALLLGGEVIPEPGSLLMLMGAAVGLALAWRRR